MKTVWTTESGLPQNSVNAIVQTRDGYLWLGTYDGLVRFDGIRFTTFTPQNAPGLKGSRVRTMAEDGDGALWIGTDDSGVAQYANGAFRTWTTKDGLPGNRVEAVAAARDGGVWVGTTAGVARLQSGRVQIIDNPLHNAVWAVREDSRRNLWIGTQNGLVRRTGGQITVFTVKDGLPQDRVEAIYETRDGKLWIGTGDTTGGGVAVYQNGTITPFKLPVTPHAGIHGFWQDGQGSLWVATWDDGLIRLPAHDGERAVQFTPREGLPSNGVRSFLEDREGNLWIGSDSGGLGRWRRKRIAAMTTEDGLATDTIYPMFEDSRGALWLGASCNGVMRRQNGPNGWKLKHWTTKEDLNGGCVHAVGEDAGGNIWIGTTKGLAYLEGERFVYRVTGDLPRMCVHSLYRDPSGTLWVGEDAGLHRLNPDGSLTDWRTKDGLVESEGVRFLTADREGALWVGTTGGISRFKGGRFTNYTTEQGLSHNHVRAIHADTDGTIWVGTYGGGLNRFRGGKFVAITTKNGLASDVISRLIEDERGNFWMSGNRGVFRVSRRELNDFADGRIASVTCAMFGVADGMPSGDISSGVQPAGWKMRDGKLWFPTDKGIAIFDPLEADSPPPPVFIEQATLDGEPSATLPPVRVEPGKEKLEIHYTGLNLSRPELVRFKYQLAGLDNGWTDAGTRRTAYYSHLPPGQYTFNVIAVNGDGVWNRAGASIRVVVIPPFYRTWWFLSLVLAGVGGLALAGYKLRVHQLDRARAEQEAFSQKLIATQEEERRRLAVELHDGLGQSLVIIKNRALLSLTKPDDHDRALTQMGEISEAASSALMEIREIASSLHPYQIDQFGLASALETMIARVADSSEIKFSHQIDAINGELSKEAQINLYRIVQESLNNIVKHSAATEVRVLLKKDSDALHLLVEDNGKGFNASAIPSGSRGMGLTGIAERAKAIGAKPEIHSQPGQGTTITLDIGLKRSEEAK